MNHSHANSFLFSMILFFAVFHIWFKKFIRNRKSRYIHNQKAFGFRKSSTLSATEWALKESISEKETTLMGPESVYIRKRDDLYWPWTCVYQKEGRPIATPSSLLCHKKQILCNLIWVYGVIINTYIMMNVWYVSLHLNDLPFR